MTAKEYLEQARYIDQEINNKIRQLEMARADLYSLTGPENEMPRQETRSTDGFSRAVARVIDLETAINRRIDELIDLKLDILRSINALDLPKHRLVLEERYILLKPWKEIAEHLGCVERQIHRYHAAALKVFKVSVKDTKRQQ